MKSTVVDESLSSFKPMYCSREYQASTRTGRKFDVQTRRIADSQICRTKRDLQTMPDEDSTSGNKTNIPNHLNCSRNKDNMSDYFNSSDNIASDKSMSVAFTNRIHNEFNDFLWYRLL